jgi:hypothetical protein
LRQPAGRQAQSVIRNPLSLVTIKMMNECQN